MYRCVNKCGPQFGVTTYWTETKPECPMCGERIIDEKPKKKFELPGTIHFHKRWTARNMNVGLDTVYCPTRQSYIDACKHGRVIRAGTREIVTCEIEPTPVKD